MIVVSDRIARAFNRYEATEAIALDISKAFERFGMLVFFTNLSLMEFQVRYLALFWYAGLLHKLKSYGISGQIFGLILSFVSKKWLQVVLHGKSSQECPVDA